MPSLSPVSEVTKSLSSLAEGTETLSVLSEATETLTALAELTNDVVTTLGFFPGLTLSQSVRSEHPFPSLTTYPGATYSTPATGLTLDAVAEATETLTPLMEI